jgi:hypothetical protein
VPAVRHGGQGQGENRAHGGGVREEDGVKQSDVVIVEEEREDVVTIRAATLAWIERSNDVLRGAH